MRSLKIVCSIMIMINFDNGGLAMQLEDYLMMLAPDDIRLKGTRIGIETVALI